MNVLNKYAPIKENTMVSSRLKIIITNFRQKKTTWITKNKEIIVLIF